jgi:hypothetical protein
VLVLNEPFTPRIAVASILVFAGIGVVKAASSRTAASSGPTPYKKPGQGAYATR